MINLVLPIYWTKTYKTKPDKVNLVGLNWYRNAFYIDQNLWKKEMTSLIASQLSNAIPISTTFLLDIKIYYKNSNCDGSNISALIEKVALDALQEHNIITNDNVKFHLGTTWSISGQDKINPRAEITLKIPLA